MNTAALNRSRALIEEGYGAELVVCIDIHDPTDASPENTRANAANFITAAVERFDLGDDQLRALLEDCLRYRRERPIRDAIRLHTTGW